MFLPQSPFFSPNTFYYHYLIAMFAKALGKWIFCFWDRVLLWVWLWPVIPCVAQADLKLRILMPQPSKYLNYRHIPPPRWPGSLAFCRHMIEILKLILLYLQHELEHHDMHRGQCCHHRDRQFSWHLPADLNLEEVDLPRLTENSQVTVVAKIIDYHGFLKAFFLQMFSSLKKKPRMIKLTYFPFNILDSNPGSCAC